MVEFEASRRQEPAALRPAARRRDCPCLTLRFRTIVAPGGWQVWGLEQGGVHANNRLAQ
jgi:hypothetical protein